MTRIARTLAVVWLAFQTSVVTADSCSCGYVIPPLSTISASSTTAAASSTSGGSSGSSSSGSIATSTSSSSSASSSAASSSSSAVHSDSLYFQESILSDFTQANLDNTQWTPQTYQVSADASNAPNGRAASEANVISNPYKDPSQKSQGTAQGSGDAGLQLWVRSALQDNLIPISEINTVRRDIQYGTFRIGMKAPSIPGTCSTFFFYQNDTQEIDLAFLSKEMTDNSHPVNLVLHSQQSLDNGNDASKTPGFKLIPLPANPTTGFHEYRFDWLPTGVSFYVDGAFVTQITDSSVIPSSPGMLAVSHSSNGNPAWSGGPPTQDSVLTVSYMQAYFNTTSTVAQKDTCNSNGQCVVNNLTPGNATASVGVQAPLQPNAQSATASATSTGAQSTQSTTSGAYATSISGVSTVLMFCSTMLALLW